MKVNLKKQYELHSRIRHEDKRSFVANSVIEVVEDYYNLQPGYIVNKKHPPRVYNTPLTVCVYLLLNMGFAPGELRHLIHTHPSVITRRLIEHKDKIASDSEYATQIRQIVNQLPVLDI